jgi:uridylate kinase
MKTVIISVGGSKIYPQDRDAAFVASLKDTLLRYDNRYILICGGGALARKYQAEANTIDSDELDWLGIKATRENAEFVRSYFDAPDVITDPTIELPDARVLVAGGWKPGFSTDNVAVTLAKNIGANEIINLTNVDHVYDADPKTNPSAKPLDTITWSQYKKIINDPEWVPGANYPFDPVASRNADGLKVYIISKLSELEKVLQGQRFSGTLIH